MSACKKEDDCPTPTWCKSDGKCRNAESSFAAPTGLAARVVVNQALVDEIIQRARASRWGLDEAENGPDMDVYADSDIDALAQCLVSSWTAKYDLVSVFSSAMSVIQEKAANDQSSATGAGHNQPKAK